jgi:hypothetical protein
VKPKAPKYFGCIWCGAKWTGPEVKTVRAGAFGTRQGNYIPRHWHAGVVCKMSGRRWINARTVRGPVEDEK